MARAAARRGSRAGAGEALPCRLLPPAQKKNSNSHGARPVHRIISMLSRFGPVGCQYRTLSPPPCFSVGRFRVQAAMLAPMLFPPHGWWLKVENSEFRPLFGRERDLTLNSSEKRRVGSSRLQVKRDQCANHSGVPLAKPACRKRSWAASSGRARENACGLRSGFRFLLLQR